MWQERRFFTSSSHQCHRNTLTTQQKLVNKYLINDPRQGKTSKAANGLRIERTSIQRPKTDQGGATRLLAIALPNPQR